MSIKPLAIVFSLLAIGSASAQDAAVSKSQHSADQKENARDAHTPFWRSARVSIGADGKVTDVHFDDWTGKKADVVGEGLLPLVRGWHFEPGRLDGVPAPTETSLQLNLDMRALDDDSYAITIVSAETGGGFLKMVAPQYPREAFLAKDEARVTLLVSVSGAGQPIDVVVEKVISPNWMKKQVVQAASDAAKLWRFRPEIVGGHPTPFRAHVPVMFCMDAGKCSSIAKQIAEQDGATEAGKRALDTPVALDSQVKLVTEVAGLTL